MPDLQETRVNLANQSARPTAAAPAPGGLGMYIGDVAKRAELLPKTIRSYEEIGLITPLRDTNGHRAFRDSDLHRLIFPG